MEIDFELKLVGLKVCCGILGLGAEVLGFRLAGWLVRIFEMRLL